MKDKSPLSIVMGIMEKRKADRGADREPEEKEEGEDGYQLELADDLIRAVKAADKQGVVDAFTALANACSYDDKDEDESEGHED